MTLVALDEPYLIHSLPGRMRIHLPGGSRAEQRSIETRLLQVPGVQEVRANPLTCNLLVRFTVERTDEREILAALRRAGRPGAGSHRVMGASPRPQTITRMAPRPGALHGVDLILQAIRLVADLLMCESPLALVLIGIEFLRFAITLLTQWSTPLSPAPAVVQPVCTCCPVHGPVFN